MSQPNDVDQSALRRVDTDPELVADRKLLTPEIESVASEDMDCHELAQGRDAVSARNRDIDAAGNDVRQTVPGKGGNETESASGSPVGDFQQVLIDLG